MRTAALQQGWPGILPGRAGSGQRDFTGYGFVVDERPRQQEPALAATGFQHGVQRHVPPLSGIHQSGTVLPQHLVQLSKMLRHLTAVR